MADWSNALRDIPWRLLACIAARPAVASWLIRRAQCTPYTPIKGPDGCTYMDRWWLFNPYPAESDGSERRWGDWLPSVRVHHIRRPDSDRHLHDHPWNARTIVLRGWYVEELPATITARGFALRNFRGRRAGGTGRLLFGEFHRIERISDGGVFTLFITWRYRGAWGFDVDGRKVPWREYFGLAPKPRGSDA